MSNVDSTLRVALVVLGDIGRSPRMQNHCIQLLNHPNIERIDIHSYYETTPKQELLQNQKVCFVEIKAVHLLSGMAGLLFKAIILFFRLFINLLFNERYDYLIVQNPPSFPTLLVCQIIGLVKGTRIIIDWHNFGYTILGLKTKNRALVKFAKYYEELIPIKNTYLHICVSDRMKLHLESKFKTRNIIVVKDKPVQKIKENQINRQGLKKYLAEKYFELQALKATPYDAVNENEQPFILISSTSWTKDEDFQILLDALYELDSQKNSRETLCIITGKGPLKEYYEKKINTLELKTVKIITMFVDIEDYMKLISICDLGVCLHQSSSGLDLPMKVVDMFSCYVPVLALHYETIKELVQEDFNGRTFKSAQQLFDQLKILVTQYETTGRITLERYRKNLQHFNVETFGDLWEEGLANAFTL